MSDLARETETKASDEKVIHNEISAARKISVKVSAEQSSRLGWRGVQVVVLSLTWEVRCAGQVRHWTLRHRTLI